MESDNLNHVIDPAHVADGHAEPQVRPEVERARSIAASAIGLVFLLLSAAVTFAVLCQFLFTSNKADHGILRGFYLFVDAFGDMKVALAILPALLYFTVIASMGKHFSNRAFYINCAATVLSIVALIIVFIIIGSPSYGQRIYYAPGTNPDVIPGEFVAKSRGVISAVTVWFISALSALLGFRPEKAATRPIQKFMGMMRRS